ncbi:hypothetical protein NO1_0286 [Candidatus Termititenax aidoneus]|uniref:Uncharacterized protein n=1 Tax=Termititenax aidoneus TaxID=2218524 RepID=A0A388T8W5_TERA1|nr:hypothetical protein NO1_0286 [Candidatus Termititenax aidoneus]
MHYVRNASRRNAAVRAEKCNFKNIKTRNTKCRKLNLTMKFYARPTIDKFVAELIG